MIDWIIVQRLMQAFPNSFINEHGEFIAHDEANQYFTLKSCETELDVKCKVLEWFSRGTHKTQPFGPAKSRRFQDFMLGGVNAYLNTSFTRDDMHVIYTHLGNSVDHNKTIRFIESGFDINILKRSEKVLLVDSSLC